VNSFSILCGLGLVMGYALLGASWLVLKTEGALRRWAYDRIQRLLPGVLVILGLVLCFALFTELRIVEHWWGSPWLITLPMTAVLATAALFIACRRRLSDLLPFALTTLLFIVGF
jgi:cytochrome d ubiquinol oxidase subunit II